MVPVDRVAAMVDALTDVPGIRAVALGGSRARGTHHDGSDVDLGLYYDADELDVAALSTVAYDQSDGDEVVLAGPGSWGPWVDGGAWLTVDGTAVDWILRDVVRVRQECHRARTGEFHFHAQPGHPLGFLDISYAGEIATCRPLADSDHLISDLRALLTPYPRALRASMIANLWQAGFHVEAAAKGVPKQDIAYVMLCCTSALMLCAHAWHAAAGQWVTNEKGLVVDVDRLGIDSRGFVDRARQALACPGTAHADLDAAVSRTRQVVESTRAALETR